MEEGGYGCEVGGFTVIHHAVIRRTGTPEWPSLFPPERPANGGASCHYLQPAAPNLGFGAHRGRGKIR